LSKYDLLRNHLRALDLPAWVASFTEVERVLASPLPSSARRFSAWWANQQPPLVHTRAWLDAGWRTAELDLSKGRVTFRRCRSAARDRTESPRHRSKEAGQSQRSRLQASRPHPGDTADLVEAKAQFLWQPIGQVRMDDARHLVFPRAPRRPGLYRFRILGCAREARYIGEADNISRRFGFYQRPGARQEAYRRIHAEFVEALEGGGAIAVAIATEAVIADPVGGFTPMDLTEDSARRLLENATIVNAAGNDITIPIG
jgi:hypothetical protein